MYRIESEVAATALENPLAAWQTHVFDQSSGAQATPQFMPVKGGLDVRVPISQQEDLVIARRAGRLLAVKLGFSESRIALVLTAISELARNIIRYAGHGEILLATSNDGHRDSIVVIAADQGPGIADLLAVTGPALAASQRNGMGLSGLKLCMDHFSIDSRPGAGTRVTCEVYSGC